MSNHDDNIVDDPARGRQRIGAILRDTEQLNAIDPVVRMATVTVQAVDQIGAKAADQIEEAALAFEAKAAEVSDKLRKLADAVRHHSQVAADAVENFCGRATTVIESVNKMHDQIQGTINGANSRIDP